MEKPFVLDDAQVDRALVIAAHPDDVDFLASGTVARWTARGIRVAYCVVTDGDAGGAADLTERSTVPALRREEQIAAAKTVGVEEVHFLGYTDGSVEVTAELRRDLSRVIRQVKPDRVVMHSPEINWPWLPDYHPDHRAAGEAALRAVYPDARNDFAHPELLRTEGLQPWTVREIWMVGAPNPNHWVEVTAQFALKMQALHAHVSQTAHVPDLETTVRARLQEQASAAGLPGLAEAFQVVATV